MQRYAATPARKLALNSFRFSFFVFFLFTAAVIMTAPQQMVVTD
jgi:hypothetical protein